MQVPKIERRREGFAARGEGGVVEPARQRKIIHIDMDAFYASVEQRDNPELRGKPVAVGGSRERGVVAAASYEARKFGIHSAMPSVTAKRKCPELLFVKPRFDVYRAVSHQVREIFTEYTPEVEPVSLDEAYLDVSENLKRISSATEIAEQIRARIRSETGLTASAGVSYNKFLAKMASNERKPDGLFVITPRMGPAFVESLPVGRFHGIGPVTRAKMERLGIRKGGDLKAQSSHFSSSTSESRVPTITGSHGASTNARSAQIAFESPSVQRTRSVPISSRSTRHARLSSRSSHRCGRIVSSRQFAGARLRSRPNTQTSSRSPAAGPASAFHNRSRGRGGPLYAARIDLSCQQGHPFTWCDPLIPRRRV